MAELTAAWLVVNYNCNNRCLWCYQKDAPIVEKTMGIETAVDSFEFLRGLGIEECIILGGEPTLHRRLPEIIELSIKSNIRPTIITNGRKLAKPKYVDLLVGAGLKSLCVSVEGTSPKTHDQITKRVGSFKQTLSGIQNTLDQGLKVSTATTISEENLSDVVGIVQFLSQLGVSEIGFNIATTNTNPDVYKNEMLLSETIGIMKQIIEAGKQNDVPIHFAASIPLCLAEENSEIDQHFRGNCFVYYGGGLVVDPDGQILPCVHWVNCHIDSIYTKSGTVKSADQFLKGWNIGIPRKFRENLWRYPAKRCSTCKRWSDESCIGGCPLLKIGRDLSKEIDQQAKEATIC